MARIYIVNDSGHRYHLAEELVPNAELIAMTKGNVNPTQVDRLAFQLNEFIALSTVSDYLLLSGTPILNALAGMLWILRHRECKMLIFEAKEQKYEQYIVDRANLERILDERLFS